MQNFWAYFWFVEQMLLNLSFFVHNASWFNVTPFIGTSGMRKRPKCPREKMSLEIFLAIFKSIMSYLWQFIVTPKCLICLETVNCKKDSGAAAEVERVVPFSHLIWIFFKFKPNDTDFRSEYSQAAHQCHLGGPFHISGWTDRTCFSLQDAVSVITQHFLEDVASAESLGCCSEL